MQTGSLLIRDKALEQRCYVLSTRQAEMVVIEVQRLPLKKHGARLFLTQILMRDHASHIAQVRQRVEKMEDLSAFRWRYAPFLEPTASVLIPFQT